MEHISASKRCESSRVRFEERKGERQKQKWSACCCNCALAHRSHQGSSASILLVTLCSQHSSVGPDLESSFHKWLHLFLLQVSHWIFAWAAVGAHWRVTQLSSHLSGRTHVLPLAHWGSASSLGSTTTFITCEQDHLPSCGGCSRCGWHSLAEFSREFWAIKKISNAYRWSH